MSDYYPSPPLADDPSEHPPPEQCPVCGSSDIKRNTPTYGEHECRYCGHIHNNEGKTV